MNYNSTTDHQHKIILGPWVTLPGGYGEDFATQKNRIAGAQANRLSVWDNSKLIKEIFSTRREGGYPRWSGSSLYWGDGWIDINTKEYFQIENIENAFAAELKLPDLLSGQGNYVPVIYAWSPDGEFVLVSLDWTGENGPALSRVMLIHKNGTVKKIVWEGNDLAPKAAFIGKNWIVTGTRNPGIYDYNGRLIKILEGKLLPERIESDEKETRLLIHGFDGITVLDTRNWQVISFIKGNWLDAAISEDGEFLMLIDFEGCLFSLAINEREENPEKLIMTDRLASIRFGDNYLVGAFSMGDPIRMCMMEIR